VSNTPSYGTAERRVTSVNPDLTAKYRKKEITKKKLSAYRKGSKQMGRVLDIQHSK
jgi:hypothetical protein